MLVQAMADKTNALGHLRTARRIVRCRGRFSGLPLNRQPAIHSDSTEPILRQGAMDDLPGGRLDPHERIYGDSLDPENDNEPIPEYPKSPGDHKKLKAAIKDLELFPYYEERVLDLIVNLFQDVNVADGDVIFKQGDPGNHFYVVASGHFKYYVNGKCVGEDKDSGEIGESSLICQTTRVADMKACSAGKLWRLERLPFRRYLARFYRRQQKLEKILKGMPIFSMLTERQYSRVSDMLQSKPFEAGAKIYEKGEPGLGLYIVEEGSVTRTGKTGTQQLGPDDYFGEAAFTAKDECYADSVTAKTSAICAFLPKDTFEYNFGSYTDIQMQAARGGCCLH